MYLYMSIFSNKLIHICECPGHCKVSLTSSDKSPIKADAAAKGSSVRNRCVGSMCCCVVYVPVILMNCNHRKSSEFESPDGENKLKAGEAINSENDTLLADPKIQAILKSVHTILKDLKGRFIYSVYNIYSGLV